MVQRLFLNRVDAIAAGPAIGGQDDFAVLVCTDKTQALLTFMQPAGSWTYIALYTAILQYMPVFCTETLIIE